MSGRHIALLSAVPVLLLSLWFAWPASAAVGYRAVSANSNGGATSLSLSTPTGTVSGDVMIAVVSVRGGTGTTITAPTGWQLINSNNSTTVLKSSVYYGVYDTVGAGPYNFTFASQKASGVIISFSGVDNKDPVNVHGSQANASLTTMTAPSITTTVPNTMLVGAYSSAVGTTFSAGSSMTLQSGAQVSSSGGAGNTRTTSGMQYVLQAGAAASGSKTMTAATAAVSVGHLVALRPDPVVSQSSYRFFQNTNSTTASTPLANKDTQANIEQQTPFRLRLNLGVASGGSNLTAAAARTYTLQFAKLTDASCAVQTGYANVTASSTVQFYNNATPVNGAAYVADVTNDPSRAGISPIGQKYHEANPLSMATAVAANQDALWDIALTTSIFASYGDTYCFKVLNLNGSYSIYPQFTIPTPTVSQANYRFFANANSTTPGAPLAAQDTAPTVAEFTPFRLRQRLAVDGSSIPSSHQDYKLQYAEKTGACSGLTYDTYVNPVFSQTRYAGTGTSNPTNGGSVPWMSPANATGAANSIYATAESSLSEPTYFLMATNYGFTIPAGTTITGIEVTPTMGYNAGGSDTAVEDQIMLVDNSNAVGDNMSTFSNFGWVSPYGGTTDLWGHSWTPSSINSSGFGFAASASVNTTGGNVVVEFDAAAITVHYSYPMGDIAYYDNPSASDMGSISSNPNDPTNGARPTIYQKYRETDPFDNSSGIPSGSDGLWDFALISSPAAEGKTFCFRVVKSDGSLLDSYTNYPEITFGTGGGESGPTTEQKLRGGRTVQGGVKSPFEP